MSGTNIIAKISMSLNAPSFFNTIRVSNSLDPDQARRFVGQIHLATTFFHLDKVSATKKSEPG